MGGDNISPAQAVNMEMFKFIMFSVFFTTFVACWFLTNYTPLLHPLIFWVLWMPLVLACGLILYIQIDDLHGDDDDDVSHE